MRRLAALAAILPLSMAPLAPAGAATVPLAAHKATYSLILDTSHQTDVQNVSGTMAYEVTDACDGWAVRQRLQMTVTGREGQDIDMVSDYVTWESKDGTKLSFHMKQSTDNTVTEQVDGDAHFDTPGGAGTIHYTTPADKQVALPAGTLFPMAHTEAIIAAAEEGKHFVALPLFDGTSADGPQNTSVVVQNWLKPEPVRFPGLSPLPSGHVRVAFFDRKKDATSPDYEVAMRYWENGVADDLVMNFTDFVVDGKLATFSMPASHC